MVKNSMLTIGDQDQWTAMTKEQVVMHNTDLMMDVMSVCMSI